MISRPARSSTSSSSSPASSKGSQGAVSLRCASGSSEKMMGDEKDKEKGKGKERDVEHIEYLHPASQQQQQCTTIAATRPTANSPSIPPNQQAQTQVKAQVKEKESILQGDDDQDQDTDFDPTHGAKPYSPFYIHPMTETSKMHLHNEREAMRAFTRTHTHTHSTSAANTAAMIDLESGGRHTKEYSSSTRPSCDAERWGLIHKSSHHAKNRGGRVGRWLGRLDRRTRFVVKVLVAVGMVSVMFAVGIGLTMAVSGRPWPVNGPAGGD